MYRAVWILITVIAFSCSCKEGDTYITNVTAPEDWNAPIIEWRTQPDPEVRGTVGIDFAITDSSEISSIRAYVDGIMIDSVFTQPSRLELNSESLLDGVHVAEIRATDAYCNLGISPILRLNVMNSVAQGPQLIWVPDNFARIQDAINAAIDFDTIRVRDGVYYETLNLFGKGIWLESENGPLRCRIDGEGAHNTVFMNGSRSNCTVRGFDITGASFVSLELEDGSQCDLFNCIVRSSECESQTHVGRAGGSLRNNLFIGGDECITAWSLIGAIENNIMMESLVAAMWNSNFGRNPVIYGFNLFWQNEEDYFGFSPGFGDLYTDPQVDLETGELAVSSPAIDAGNPQILDLDSSRSDIGPFGGPWAY